MLVMINFFYSRLKKNVCENTARQESIDKQKRAEDKLYIMFTLINSNGLRTIV